MVLDIETLSCLKCKLIGHDKDHYRSQDSLNLSQVLFHASNQLNTSLSIYIYD